MDWQSVLKQQQELETAFGALKQVFEQAEVDFKNRNKVIMEMIAQMNTKDADNMSKIHQALQAILESNSSVKK